MPHYKDGTPAQVGDTVKGKGYNVKDKDGNLKVIVGTVVGIIPDSEACNIRVAHVVAQPIPDGFIYPPRGLYQQTGVICTDGRSHGVGGMYAVLEMEYGQCDHFEKVA